VIVGILRGDRQLAITFSPILSAVLVTPPTITQRGSPLSNQLMVPPLEMDAHSMLASMALASSPPRSPLVVAPPLPAASGAARPTRVTATSGWSRASGSDSAGGSRGRVAAAQAGSIAADGEQRQGRNPPLGSHRLRKLKALRHRFHHPALDLG